MLASAPDGRRRQHGRRATPTIAALATLAAVLLAGCGGSAPRPSTGVIHAACSPRTVAALATADGGGSVEQAGFTAPNGSHGCRFSSGGARALRVTVSIDSAPQAHFRLDREVVEYGQTIIWSHQGSRPYPQYLAGLGMEADWLPVPRELLATDGVRIIFVTVTRWPGASGAAERAAERVVRLYLRHGGDA